MAQQPQGLVGMMLTMLRDSFRHLGSKRGKSLPVNINDVRLAASHRGAPMPLVYVDGGAEDEVTQRANRAAFEEVVFQPQMLVDVAQRDLSVTVLGKKIAFPVILGPTAMPGLQHPVAELGAARAAHAAGTIFTVSTASSFAVDEVAAESSGPLWFQLYPWKDRTVMAACIDRALAAGCHALMLTVDAAVPGKRERDLHVGMTLPPQLNRPLIVGALRHPVRYARWLNTMSSGPGMRLGNVEGLVSASAGALGMAGWFEKLFIPSVTWQDVNWIRSRWKGPFLLKGIITTEQAREAAAEGVDGVIVSNHGGRQLDGLPASLRMLPSIVETLAGTQVEVLFDSGIRRGSDIVKALALGARACLVGRPWVWGLAADGQAGVTLVLDILRTEFDRTLALMGVPAAADLRRDLVLTPDSWPTVTSSRN